MKRYGNQQQSKPLGTFRVGDTFQRNGVTYRIVGQWGDFSYCLTDRPDDPHCYTYHNSIQVQTAPQ